MNEPHDPNVTADIPAAPTDHLDAGLAADFDKRADPLGTSDHVPDLHAKDPLRTTDHEPKAAPPAPPVTSDLLLRLRVGTPSHAFTKTQENHGSQVQKWPGRAGYRVWRP